MARQLPNFAPLRLSAACEAVSDGHAAPSVTLEEDIRRLYFGDGRLLIQICMYLVPDVYYYSVVTS